MKKAFIILGNGFTIDFLNYYAQIDNSIWQKINVCNLFKLGDRIGTPWDKKPGFLSFKTCPALWTLGARPGNSDEESTALIEEIITCANMYFDFVNEPGQKRKRLELANDGDRLYLKAYAELIVYLRHLFACYDAEISDDKLQGFINSATSWGWLSFFKNLSMSEYESVTFVTYNYDIWLERILKLLGVSFSVCGFDESSTHKITVIKPHGSISIVPRNTPATAYGISYNLDFEGVSIDQLQLSYCDLSQYDKGAIIPPAGDSMRLQTTDPWSYKLREEAKQAAQNINEQDEIVLCGISYWHVDRRELDELLVNLDQNANLTFINPLPPRDLNAVLISIFSKYVQQSTSLEIGGILNG